MRRHVPADGSGLDQHLPRRGAGDAHAVDARCAHGRRTARDLQIHIVRDGSEAIGDQTLQERWNPILRYALLGQNETLRKRTIGKERVGRRCLDMHLRPIGIELLGGHLRQRREDAGSHIAMRHHDGDRVVGGDLDPVADKLFAGTRIERVLARDAPARPQSVAHDQGARRTGAA